MRWFSFAHEDRFTRKSGGRAHWFVDIHRTRKKRNHRLACLHGAGCRGGFEESKGNNDWRVASAPISCTGAMSRSGLRHRESTAADGVEEEEPTELG
jgi:hypothetical protein